MIMNSKMSSGERYDQMMRAKEGAIDVMIGPRSALFTPFPDLGLIVVDEEHESTYKSEQIPRYHAERNCGLAGTDGRCKCSTWFGDAFFGSVLSGRKKGNISFEIAEPSTQTGDADGVYGGSSRRTEKWEPLYYQWKVTRVDGGSTGKKAADDVVY